MHRLQFTSSHLSTNGSGLGASVKSIPDYVYSQLSSPQVTSPEAKKIHQEICMVSQKGVDIPPNTCASMKKAKWASYERLVPRTFLSALIWNSWKQTSSLQPLFAWICLIWCKIKTGEFLYMTKLKIWSSTSYGCLLVMTTLHLMCSAIHRQNTGWWVTIICMTLFNLTHTENVYMHKYIKTTAFFFFSLSKKLRIWSNVTGCKHCVH